MIRFSTLDLEDYGDGEQWILTKPLEYHGGYGAPESYVRVPVGFVTDLASIPRLFWRILPRDGKYRRAAVIHDYLYAAELVYRERANEIFREAMQALGVPGWQVAAMFAAVKWFGWTNYSHTTDSVRKSRALSDLLDDGQRPLWPDGKMRFTDLADVGDRRDY